MAILTPEVDVVNVLVAATGIFSPALVAKAVGVPGNVGRGPPRAPLAADQSTDIWVMPYGGQEPDPHVNAAVDGDIFRSRIQVKIRSLPDNWQSGMDLARKVRLALHRQQPSSPAGYIYWRALSSEPIAAGVDEVGQWLFTVNIECGWNS